MLAQTSSYSAYIIFLSIALHNSTMPPEAGKMTPIGMMDSSERGVDCERLLVCIAEVHENEPTARMVKGVLALDLDHKPPGLVLLTRCECHPTTPIRRPYHAMPPHSIAQAFGEGSDLLSEQGLPMEHTTYLPCSCCTCSPKNTSLTAFLIFTATDSPMMLPWLAQAP